MQAGDAILTVNGNRFENSKEFVQLVRAGANLRLQYVRMPDAPVLEEYKELVRRAILERLVRKVEMQAQVTARSFLKVRR